MTLFCHTKGFPLPWKIRREMPMLSVQGSIKACTRRNRSVKEDNRPWVHEEQMYFHTRSDFARPTECNLSESKTRVFARRPADGRVVRESDKWVKKRST